MPKKQSLIKRINQYILHDIWARSAKRNTMAYRFLIRPLRIFFITIQGFLENKVQIRASALTYNTLLSVVPIIALVFAIAQGFGFQKMMEDEMTRYFSEQQEVLKWLLQLVRNMLEKVQGGVIAGIGVIVLLWSVMQVMMNIENTLNDIWRVKIARPWSRKLTDYLSMMMIAPILLIASSSTTAYLVANVHEIMAAIHLPSFVKSMIHFGLDLIPHSLMWGVFTLVYIVFPNTKVKFSSALIAGIVAGSLFQILQLVYFKFQMQLSSYSTVYGSLAALPLFIIWIQISWTLVLFGAEFSFAIHNIENIENERAFKQVSPRQKKLIALVLMNIISKNFKSGNKAITLSQINTSIDSSSRLVSDVLSELQSVGLISEVMTDGNNENAYQPAFDIQQMTLASIMIRLENIHEVEDLFLPTDEALAIQQKMKEIDKVIEQNSANILIAEI